MTGDPFKNPLLAEYGTYHTDPRNKLCHEYGIPLIVCSLLALLHLVHYGWLDLAQVAIALVAIYYTRLVGERAAVAVVGFIALYVIGWFISWQIAVGLFVVGWILQFVGHTFEGKRPAFLTNIAHLLVGPLWIALSLTTRRVASD